MENLQCSHLIPTLGVHLYTLWLMLPSDLSQINIALDIQSGQAVSQFLQMQHVFICMTPYSPRLYLLKLSAAVSHHLENACQGHVLQTAQK